MGDWASHEFRTRELVHELERCAIAYRKSATPHVRAEAYLAWHEALRQLAELHGRLRHATTKAAAAGE